ncbi:PQQ-dependent dehydrogenase, methanol/ethanol family [Duganella sp. Dugasp56]|uniref:PQQ-dependent dehydrogenase, methanol/ethanol family n=1 Tax=Duganella sp. Dugasp56 TaxID=3243046 RepID=UPI0039AFE3BD
MDEKSKRLLARRGGAGRRLLLAMGLFMAIGIPAAPCHATDVGKALAKPGNADADWPSYGRTSDEQRFSPLAKINEKNAARLGLAWEASLESPRFGIEASPIVVDGVMYVSSSWGRVFAFDARTGKSLWAFDPKVPGSWLRNGCCKPVNRGVAFWNGKIYVGAFDGRLIALDSRTGAMIWEANTTGGKPYYTITGAPRVVKGKVIIGNGGADFATRGFFSAYDAETGKLDWRFYVVPDDPKKGFEHPELEMAAKTWGADHDWSLGGGGNPWDSFAYDPDLNLLYVGTGNAGPFGVFRPSGGDGLFLSSMLAINPDNGRLVWHYQTTPGDSWDFTATQHMILADIKIGEQTRKVLMQAPKNGFFYVLDRATGKLLSAKNFVHVNWANGVDLETGRPNITDVGDYSHGPKLMFPSPFGGHNWHPMAFNPKTGLVYIPARDLGWIWGADRPTFFTTGYDLARLNKDDVAKDMRGMLIAWDPVAQKPAWSIQQKTQINGGVLTTAGNLVVQGTEDGHIMVYSADKGKRLKDIFIGTGIVAPPVSYMLDGEQYIALAAGWNGVKTARHKAGAPAPYDNAGRLVVLRLGGSPVPVAPQVRVPAFYRGGAGERPASLVSKGAPLYQRNCAMCHGVVGEGGVFPDLRRMSNATYHAFDEIVLGGALAPLGMASFADQLDKQQVEAIRAYIADWAERSRHGDENPSPTGASSITEKSRGF